MEQSAKDIFLENLENDLKRTFPTFLRNILKFNGLANHVSFKQLKDADLDKLEEFVRTELTELVEKDEYESYFGPFHKKLLISIEITTINNFRKWNILLQGLFSSQPCEQVFRSTRSSSETRESGGRMGVAVGDELQSQKVFPKDCEIELVCMKALSDTKDDLAKLGITSNDRSWIDICVSKYTINSQNNHNIDDDDDINDSDDDESYLDHIISEETTTEDTFLARVDEISENLEKSTPEDQKNVPEDLLNMELTGFGEQLNMKDYQLENINVGSPYVHVIVNKKILTLPSTIQGLLEELKLGIESMKNTNNSAAAITSGGELFRRFITLGTMDFHTFDECKEIMLKRGELFLKKLSEAKGKIMKLGSQFIIDGSKILTHSRSRVVLETLKGAAEQNRYFEVFVTQSQPDESGKRMYQDLKDLNIPCTLILDSAIGYIMEEVDFVMVGAEAVVESGGIVNKIGSYTMAVCARAMNKPFYVLAESFKFSRVFPLNQSDLPEEYKYSPETRKRDLSKEHPLVDYTPPSLITLLFTDLGILTPSAVSDELIKLYL
ncbi:hypothetical protein FQR65_LT08574 [Abscondita terminalis]|nr:hypothetical protein FQR65_LT08574 [Abscondita terminalis]